MTLRSLGGDPDWIWWDPVVERMTVLLLEGMDTNKDGKISIDEWEDFDWEHLLERLSEVGQMYVNCTWKRYRGQWKITHGDGSCNLPPSPSSSTQWDTIFTQDWSGEIEIQEGGRVVVISSDLTCLLKGPIMHSNPVKMVEEEDEGDAAVALDDGRFRTRFQLDGKVFAWNAVIGCESFDCPISEFEVSGPCCQVDLAPEIKNQVHSCPLRWRLKRKIE